MNLKLHNLTYTTREFNEQSGRQADRMITLTWVIVGLTVVIGVIAGIQLYTMLAGGG